MAKTAKKSTGANLPTTTTAPPLITGNPFAGGGSGTKSTIKYPDAQTLQNAGVSPDLANKLGGTLIQTKSATGVGTINAMLTQLTSAQVNKLFSYIPGFDAVKAAGGDKNQKAYLNTIWPKVETAGSLTGVNPSELVAPKALQPKAPPQPVNVNNTTVYQGSTPATNAYSTLQSQLEQAGLGNLTDTAYNLVFKNNITNNKQLWDAIRTTPQYKDAFQGLAEYNATAAKPMTEAQYLAAAQTMRNTAQQYGLPDSFFTNKEIGQLIGGGVSPAEFSRRVVNGYLVAQNADPATKQALQAQGVDMGHLLAYYFDPKAGQDAINRLQATQAARLQGYATNAGVKGLTPDMAAQLAQYERTQVNPDGTYSTAATNKALDVEASKLLAAKLLKWN